jgi:hypothetical protein
MPKKTKKKTSVKLKQKQKVKVIVNVNNKTARRRRYAPRQPKQPQQPQQIIIQQPSTISRELPTPMFNPIQQASAPPVFQGVGQMLQPPNELLRNIYRETPDFENYSQMPYMQTNLQAPQFEEPAEIQREVSSVASPSPFEKYVNDLLSRPLNTFSDVNASNKGFNEPMPKDIPLPEMIKPKRVQFSDDERSLQPTLNLTKPDRKIIQNIQQGEETDTSLATTTTKMPKKKKPKQLKEKGEEPNELQIVAPEIFTFGPPKQRGRGRPSNRLIPTEGKIENTVYNLIMNSTATDFINSGVGANRHEKFVFYRERRKNYLSSFPTIRKKNRSFVPRF